MIMHRMKTNEELQKDVRDAINWEPQLNSTKLEIATTEGDVILTGEVDSYSDKLEVESIVKRVIGVKNLVANVEVQFTGGWIRTNEQIARDVLSALDSNKIIPDNTVTVKVEDGWVTLAGELPWNYQREAAKNSVNFLAGIKGVINNLNIKPDRDDFIETIEVERAIKRSCSSEHCDIRVSVEGSIVTLSGTVDCWFHKEEAERITWNTPGIWQVENELVVEYFFTMAN